MSEALRHGYMGTLKSADLSVAYRGGILNLTPCEKINDRGIVIGLLGYKHLQPERFSFAGKDRQPISLKVAQTGETFRINYPGKSAFLFGDEVVDEETTRRWIENQYRRGKRHDDFLHLATVGEIEDAGWQVWWTPLPERDNLPHVRIVPVSVIGNGRQNPTEEEIVKLAGAFKRAS